MGLQVWLPLTEDTKNQGLSNVTVMNNGATFNSAGKLGGCYYFNRASSNYLKIDNPIATATNGVSMAFWVKLPSNGSVNDQLVHIGNGSGWTNNRFTCFVRGGNSTLIFSCGDGTNSTQYGCTSSSLTLNQWTHVVCIYNSNKLMVYLNGILDKEYNTTIIPSFANVAYIGIGAGPNATEPATTYLNDVRIYDHALSPLEVKHLSKGLVLHYPLAMPGGENLMPNSLQMQLGSADPSTGTWRIAGSSTMTKSRVQIDDITYGFQNVGIQTVNDGSCYGIDSFPMVGNTQYTISFDARIIDGTEGYAGFSIYSCTINGGSYTKIDKNYYVTPLSKDWTRCWVTFTTNATANRNIYIGITTGDTSVTTQMCRVKLELGSRATPWIPNPADAEYSTLGFNDGIEYDVSGYGNNGIRNGTFSWSSDTPRYNTSTVFNGTDNCIKFPFNDFCTNGDVFTMNIWWKKTVLGSKAYETLIGGPSGFEMDTRSGSAQALSLYMATTRGGNVYSPFNMNEWYMVTLVNDGTNELYYVNGVLVKTIEKKDMPSGNYYVGACKNETGQNFNGFMSDFRFYKTALSSSDVLELYHTPESLSHNGTLFTQGEYVES